MGKDFNDFRFEGLNYRDFSNNYWTMNRVSESEDRIVIRFSIVHLFETLYGWGLILDRNHVLWLKDWAVSSNFKGNEVLLSREFFNPKPSRYENREFDVNPDACTWEYWLNVAKEQQDTQVQWRKG